MPHSKETAITKAYAQWKKQVDDFDGVVDKLPELGDSVQLWGVFAPAVPALYAALIRELDLYKVTAGQLRGYLIAHENSDGNPIEFGERVRDTIFASRRLKGLIDAYNREKAVAEAAYPELADGSLKDTGVVGLEPHSDLRERGENEERGGKEEDTARGKEEGGASRDAAREKERSASRPS